MRQSPDKDVISWLDRQPRMSIWTTSVTILEVRLGLQIMATGKRRSLLIQAFEIVLERMGHRIASFDAAAATQAADLMAARQRKGRPGDLRDTMIAGIVLAPPCHVGDSQHQPLRRLRSPSCQSLVCLSRPVSDLVCTPNCPHLVRAARRTASVCWKGHRRPFLRGRIVSSRAASRKRWRWRGKGWSCGDCGGIL
jgi:predicted nucleic acid-binding protein